MEAAPGNGIEHAIGTRPALAPVLYAMWGQSEGHRLGRELAEAGIPVLLLKGPDLQQRLYGTPAAYPSGDVDVLVHRRDAAKARETMRLNGWRFEAENGVMWRLSAAASFEREGFRADLHWGLHAAHLPSFTLRPLERALWEGAERAQTGYSVPDSESLFVFLAVHAAGHRFERPYWVKNVYAAADQVRDWRRVWEIATASRLTRVVREAMAEQRPGTSIPLLDGPMGWVTWWTAFALRGHLIPKEIRDRLREAWALHREGYGLFGWYGDRIVEDGPLELVVGRGVFGPRGGTQRAIELALELLERSEAPSIVIDIGTGSGTLAISAGKRWPSATVYASDTSRRALRYARANAARNGVSDIQFHPGHLLQPFPRTIRGRVDLAFSNVPYVPPAGGRRKGGLDVPNSTIFGPDGDGLGFMRELSRELPQMLCPGGIWIFQVADAQLDAWAEHLIGSGFEPWLPQQRRPGKAIVAAARLAVERGRD
jgi:methylase of polypeptide subunit release factors